MKFLRVFVSPWLRDSEIRSRRIDRPHAWCRRSATLATACLLLVGLPAAGQSQSSGEGTNNNISSSEDTVRWTFDNAPSVRVRKVLRADLHVKTQTDWRDWASTTDAEEPVFDLHRARVGVDGTFLKFFEYEVERELRDSSQPWRDVYVNARFTRWLQLQAGKFKVPFSLDELTGSMDLDFIYRTLAASYLAPGRDVGVMAHGGLLKGAVKYQAAIFRRGGENVRASEQTDPQSGRTTAGRIVVRPWDGRKGNLLRTLAVGTSFTAGRVPEGPYSLRSKSVAGDSLLKAFNVNGARNRYGAEVHWEPGPGAIQGEIMRARDQRRGQSIDDKDLPDAVAHGWYLSGTWLLTGEPRSGAVHPKKPLPHGFGAVEVATRIEKLTNAGLTQPPFTATPRAANLPQASDRVWTVGVNWYLNDFVKVQFDLIREQRELGGTVMSAGGRTWSRVFGLQFGI